MENNKSKDQKRGLLASVTRFTPREFRRITREMYGQNLELSQVNKTLSLLNAVDSIVLQSHTDMDVVCAKITDVMVNEYATCAFAAIFCRSQDRRSTEELAAWTCDWLPGVDRPAAKQFVENLTPNASYDWRTARSALLTDDISTISHLLDAESAAMKSFAKQMQLHHFYAARLASSRGSIGTLILGVREENAKRDKELLGRVSEAISMALDNKLLQEENERILLRLQKSNDKLRTLDETKDDFISMASHQLRTPLTSVKGYVSMVLDGDVGPLNPMQQKLLNQSFISAQRMAYLIADLLNLSRLKTGKFIIEPTPTNLAQITRDEVSQLVETAKGRGLELTYDKPQDFPTYMLDVVKTRQVVMNFVDNAIYYTPSGGHIHVELKDNPKTIELRVIDDGIGVPRDLQRHLFTKFYRAPNAQKARPDGTGLGLFMAKKVIVAQRGAIIYESTEGKGSVFGFSFAKSHLQVPPAQPIKPATAKK